MRPYLLLICLASFLTGCVEITLSVSEQLLPDLDLPYKTVTQVGNTCLTSDGGQATVLLRLASNRPKDVYTSSILVRSEVVVIKTTEAGQIVWTKPVWLGTHSATSRPLIYPLRDGSYWLFLTRLKATGSSSPSQQEAVLVHLNATGEVMDQQPLAGALPAGFMALGIVSVPGNGFVVKGVVSQNATINPQLIRFDQQGRWQWQRTYETVPVLGQAYGLAATSDGGLLLSSYVTNTIQATDGLVMRLNANGESVWTRQYTSVRAALISESTDKGYILLDQARSSAGALAMFRLNQTGDVVWSQVLPSATNSYRQPLAVFAQSETIGALSWEPATNSFDWLTADPSGRQQTHQRVAVAGVSNALVRNDPVRLSSGSFICTVSHLNRVSLVRITPGNGTDWVTVLAINTD